VFSDKDQKIRASQHSKRNNFTTKEHRAHRVFSGKDQKIRDFTTKALNTQRRKYISQKD
jgi:hypothetical protein